MDIKHVVKESAYRAGFDLVAVSSAETEPADRDHYKEWVTDGYAGDLAYMVREYPRRWIPQDLLPEAKSVITLAVNFFSGEKRSEPKFGFGRVARYAWGKDYHIVVQSRLQEWVEILKGITGSSLKTKILVDSSPFLERSFARKSGLGFFGKNTLLISRQLGSFIFLSEVLTNLELEQDSFQSPVSEGKDECGSCRECLDVCPTQALVAPRRLDARRCISYWTIENRGAIPEEMRASIGDWIFGCDLCQEVCPYVGLSRQSSWQEFLPDYGVGTHVSLIEVLSMKTEEEFRYRFKGTPLLRAKRMGLLRNACIVSANQKFEAAAPLLKNLAENDPNPILRTHASWSLKKMNQASD
ncbi:MAG: tRNA epoxyqueuosine(34) reductase QueG [Elusimicrobia bacterium]|nr:tRNA epoxyqueuosine(34) reductase QueG [Elusimicrobiota bacterium]